MNRILAVAAASEAATGVALIAFPSVVADLLFGSGIVAVDIVLARIAGIALVALGIACWPGAPAMRPDDRPYAGMLTYLVLSALCLAYVGLAGPSTGRLLWPAIVAHVILAVLLAIAWSRERASVSAGESPNRARSQWK